MLDTYQRDEWYCLINNNIYYTKSKWCKENKYISKIINKYHYIKDMRNIISSMISLYLNRIRPIFYIGNTSSGLIKDDIYDIMLYIIY